MERQPLGVQGLLIIEDS